MGVGWGELSGEGVVWSKLLLKVLFDTHLKKALSQEVLGSPAPVPLEPLFPASYVECPTKSRVPERLLFRAVVVSDRFLLLSDCQVLN